MARNGILAATTVLSLACGGGVGSDDAGGTDATADVQDASNHKDVTLFDSSTSDAAADAQDASTDAREEMILPPPPYGAPPNPRSFVV